MARRAAEAQERKGTLQECQEGCAAGWRREEGVAERAVRAREEEGAARAAKEPVGSGEVAGLNPADSASLSCGP